MSVATVVHFCACEHVKLLMFPIISVMLKACAFMRYIYYDLNVMHRGIVNIITNTQALFRNRLALAAMRIFASDDVIIFERNVWKHALAPSPPNVIAVLFRRFPFFSFSIWVTIFKKKIEKYPSICSAYFYSL